MRTWIIEHKCIMIKCIPRDLARELSMYIHKRTSEVVQVKYSGSTQNEIYRGSVVLVHRCSI